MKTITKMLAAFVGLSIGLANAQNTLEFTGVNATPEKAIQLHWASNSNEVYEIDYATSLIDTNTGTITWNPLYTDYPSHGTNSFWLDTGNYFISPALQHPKNDSMRFYRVVLTGTDTANSEPTITIISPTNGAMVSSNITVAVFASSADVLAEVKLYIDGQEMPHSSDGTNFIINTCEWWNGSHILFATAKSVSHYEGIPTDTSITYGHAVSSYVNLTFNNLITEVAFSQPYFEPSLGQTQEVTAYLTLNSDWILKIQDANGNTVRTETGSGNYLTFDWDGTGTGGTNIADGVYRYFISAHTNGQPNQTLVVSGSGSDDISPPGFSMSSSLMSANNSQVMQWITTPDGSGGVLPLAIYPPGFDTNGLIIFEATPSQIQSLVARPARSSNVMLNTANNFTPNDYTPSGTSSVDSSESTTTPIRPPTSAVKGTIGTFYAGFQDYSTPGYSSFLMPPIASGFPFVNKWVIVDNETSQSDASHNEHFGDVIANAQIAKGFASTMRAGSWNGVVNPFITKDQVTGGVFNQANVGLLCCHGSYGKTEESDGITRSYLRFFSSYGQGGIYCRLDDCSFGSSGINGLKYMALLVCNSLNNVDYNSLYINGRLPINSDLHILLGASTVVTAAPDIGSLFAGNLLGNGTNQPPQSVITSWFNAGNVAYIGETNAQLVIKFRAAYWPDALTEQVTDVNLNPGTGNPLDIEKVDATVH